MSARRRAVVGAVASAALVAAALALLALVAIPGVAQRPAGPIPAGLADLDPETCGGCHRAAYEAWSASQHARAFVDPFFQAGFRRDPDPFCRACHAPRARPGQGRHRREPRWGVDCATCHVRGGVVRGRVTEAGRRAHAMGDGSAERCATCHQFRFPAAEGGLARYDPAGWMQRTEQEWRESPAALRGEGCADCHARTPEGAFTHRMRGPDRDPELLREALRLDVERPLRRLLRVRVAATEAVGHRVPTGDLFRELRVRVESAGIRQERVLTRRFRLAARPGPWPPWRVEREDERLAPGTSRTFRFVVDGAAPAEVELEWLRLSPARAAAQGLARDAIGHVVARTRVP